MTNEVVEQLAALGRKQSDHLVSAGGQDEDLLVSGDAIGALFLQLFQGVKFGFGGEFVLEEFCIHEHLALLSFDDHDVFDHILVGKESENRCFFLAVPDYHALVV